MKIVRYTLIISGAIVLLGFVLALLFFKEKQQNDLRTNLNTCTTREANNVEAQNLNMLESRSVDLNLIDTVEFEEWLDYFNISIHKGKVLLTTGRELRWFNLLQTASLHAYAAPDDKYMTTGTFDLDDNLLVLLGNSTGDGRINFIYELYNVTKNQSVKEIPLNSLNRYEEIFQMMFSLNGNCLFLISWFHVYILETQTYTLLTSFEPGFINDFTLSHNTDKLAFGSFGDDDSTGEAEVGVRFLTSINSEFLFEEPNLTITTVRFLPDNNRLISSSLDGSIRIWDIELKTLISTIETSNYVIDFDVLSPYIVALDDKNTVTLFHLATNEKLASIELATDARRVVFVQENRFAVINKDPVLYFYEISE
jgi:WD40 repeat protein